MEQQHQDRQGIEGLQAPQGGLKGAGSSDPADETLLLRDATIGKGDYVFPNIAPDRKTGRLMNRRALARRGLKHNKSGLSDRSYKRGIKIAALCAAGAAIAVVGTVSFAALFPLISLPYLTTQSLPMLGAACGIIALQGALWLRSLLKERDIYQKRKRRTKAETVSEERLYKTAAGLSVEKRLPMPAVEIFNIGGQRGSESPIILKLNKSGQATLYGDDYVLQQLDDRELEILTSREMRKLGHWFPFIARAISTATPLVFWPTCMAFIHAGLSKMPFHTSAGVPLDLLLNGAVGAAGSLGALMYPAVGMQLASRNTELSLSIKEILSREDPDNTIAAMEKLEVLSSSRQAESHAFLFSRRSGYESQTLKFILKMLRRKFPFFGRNAEVK